MKTFIPVIFFIAFLSGCASSGPYKPFTGSKGFGYQERQLTEDRWRVTFRIRNNNLADAQDFALLRAGELALANGFDWFEVVDRSGQKHEQNRSGVSVGVHDFQGRNCNIFGCSNRTVYGTGVGLNFDEQRDYSEAIVEVRFGKGVKPDASNIYDASAITEHLRKSMIKE